MKKKSPNANKRTDKSQKTGPSSKSKTPDKRSTRSIKSSLANFFSNKEEESFTFNDIAAILKLHAHKDREVLLESLRQMMEDKEIILTKEEKYQLNHTEKFLIGTVDMAKSGGAYILVDGQEKDIYVNPRKTNKAFHGDKVKVLKYSNKRGGRIEGEIVSIIQRKKEEFTGTLQIVNERTAFVIPDSKKMVVDFFIPSSRLNGAQDGYKVLVQMTDWPEKVKNPFGKIIKILGKPGEHSTEMNVIISEFDLPEEFPLNVEKESNKIPIEISEDEIDRRWDFRDVPTMTIDPIDAKDFDDALSIQPAGPGKWEIGVHIADVSFYVRPDSELDKEAFERGTSVYLVDRVIPMLPERLSNGVCSLRPDEDKLTYAAVFVMDEEGKVLKEWFGRTVIRSSKRFSYEEAQEVLDSGVGPYANELLIMNAIAHKLRKKRFAEGSISFETDEVKFKLDDKGKPIEVFKKVRKDAHKLIEDFMLLANRKVAEYIGKKSEDLSDYPFVYRVHDAPDTEKLANFAKLAAQFGYTINLKSEETVSQSLNKLMIDIEGKPEQNLLQGVAIRSMSKAIYTTKKTSHYGLGFEYYTHFTSPIRRFPDVMVHRLLDFYLSNKIGANQELIESEAKHSTEMEIRAAEAERASIKYMQCQFMLDHIGSEFDGIISGVTDWGVYVEILENKCEGMVKISDLKDDVYVYDDQRFLIRGYNHGKTYQLGYQIRIRILSVNMGDKTIDMVFA